MQYVKAENLKYKRTMMNRLLVTAPVVTVLFAFLAGGLNIFQSTGLYWWYMFILQGMTAVLCFCSIRTEQMSGYRKFIYALPVDLKKLRLAKTGILVGKLLLASLILTLLLAVIPRLLFPIYVSYTFWELALGNLVIVLTSMWQIPFCFILIYKLGVFIPIVLNTLLGLATIVLIGNTPFWYVWPYCWAAKEMELLLNININGVPANQSGGAGIGDIAVIMAAVIFFGLLSGLDARIFERERE